MTDWHKLHLSVVEHGEVIYESSARQEWHRRFYLYRQIDDTGISGRGVVAHGVEFPDGVVVLRWVGDKPSTVVWANLGDAMKVHGHGGHTVAVYLDDDAAERAA
jgi:hypothetical protein